MNVYGVGGAAQGLVLPHQESGRKVETERSPVTPSRSTTGPAAAPASPAAPRVLNPTGPALQAEAPAGTDPELWSVLSPDERTFLARAGEMGPLTYSHMIHSGMPANAVVRGGRIDVRA